MHNIDSITYKTKLSFKSICLKILFVKWNFYLKKKIGGVRNDYIKHLIGISLYRVNKTYFYLLPSSLLKDLVRSEKSCKSSKFNNIQGVSEKTVVKQFLNSLFVEHGGT